MKTLLETSFSVLIATMVLILNATLAETVTTSTINSSADIRNDGEVRLAAEEMQFQIRGANQIQTTATVAGITYTAGPNTLILSAPAYDATQAGCFLTDKTDTIIFVYNADQKMIRETIVPAVGSQRPARTLFPIGNNVTSAQFTYNCRERFVAMTASNTNTFTLKTAPLAGSVRAYVNGTEQTVSVSNANVTVTSLLAAGNYVQIFYRPQTISTTFPINRIDFSMTATLNGVRNGERTVNASGSAQLRNYRN